MRHVINLILLLLMAIPAHNFCMDVSDQATHERALRGFKHPTTRTIAQLTAAIDYFGASSVDQPILASDCYVIDEHKQFSYTPKFWLRQCQAAKIIIKHLKPQVERAFHDLLSLELNKIDKARWPEIQKVLPYDSSIKLHSDEQLMSDLIALAHDPEANYTKWFMIIASYKKRIITKSDACHEFWEHLKEEDLSKIQTLLASGKSNINLDMPHKKSSHTPLIFAVSINNPGMCQLLLEHGAGPDVPSVLNLPGNKGDLQLTPLMLAVNLGLVDSVVQLLKHKANPNIPAIYLATGIEEHALCSAAAPIKNREKYYSLKIQDRMIRLLLQHGANKLCGKIFFYDLNREGGYQLNLKDPELTRILPTLLETTDAIDCLDGNIILRGHLFKELANSTSIQQLNTTRSKK